jgi:hypothetical protein
MWESGCHPTENASPGILPAQQEFRPASQKFERARHFFAEKGHKIVHMAQKIRVARRKKYP